MGKEEKRLRKPTRQEKEIISKAGLRWENWLVKVHYSGGLILVNKKTEKTRTIKKETTI